MQISGISKYHPPSYDSIAVSLLQLLVIDWKIVLFVLFDKYSMFVTFI